MDYAAYFSTGPPQPYHFIGLPPTPTYSHSVDHDTIRSIEPLDTAFLPPHSYDAFPFSHNLPTTSGSPDPVAQTPMPVGSLDSGLGVDMDERQSRTRSSSEEKESGLTPAQSRRKAQNRAAYSSSESNTPMPRRGSESFVHKILTKSPHAHNFPLPPPHTLTNALFPLHSQRAFRERKERHVKDLEAKLSALESSTHSLQSDNERLKLALQRARTENEILRATSTTHPSSPSASRPVSVSYPSPGAHMSARAADGDQALDGYAVTSLTNGSVITNGGAATGTGGKELPAQATWDLIQSHPLVKQGLVDIADVCERLRGMARCDGHGPVFEERAVWRTVEESRRGGGDELI
ncbi:hypothetical protein V2W45_1332348 [Cenococcum geophilum]